MGNASGPTNSGRTAIDVSLLRGLRTAKPDEERFSASVEAMAAAFGDAMRRQIYLRIRESAGLTANEIARHFALHPNVARHHLDKLASAGYLEVSVDHLAGGAGRPSKRYRVRPNATAASTSDRPEHLISALLVRALELLEPEIANKLAERAGEEYGRELVAELAPGFHVAMPCAATTTVVEALSAHGFAARVDVTKGPTAIVHGACPFGAFAAEHPVICAVDRGMVRGLFAGLCGTDVPVRLMSRALGAEKCLSVAG